MNVLLPTPIPLSQVHRRLLHDDGRGVGEPLNETGTTGEGLVIRGTHIAILANAGISPFLHRFLGDMLMLDALYGFTPSSQSYSDYVKSYRPAVSPPLPLFSLLFLPLNSAHRHCMLISHHHN